MTIIALHVIIIIMNFDSVTLTGLDSIYFNRDPIYNTELATKQYTDNIITDESVVTNTRDTDLKKP